MEQLEIVTTTELFKTHLELCIQNNILLILLLMTKKQMALRH
jgi:hypothetical protein